MNVDKIKFGLDTFGDIAIDGETGKPISYEESIRNIVKEGQLADEVGVDTTEKNSLFQVLKRF